MDQNPYAAPRILPETQKPTPPEICVDGQYIVVRNAASLPQRCVLTNEPVTVRDRQVIHFMWAPSFRLVRARHKCTVYYCVNRQHRMAAYRRRALVGLVGLVLGWLYLGIHVIWFVPVVPLAMLKMPFAPLNVKNAQDGQFWIAGCGDDFLRSCELEFGCYER